MNKARILITLIATVTLTGLTGCHSTATEAEKRQFQQSTMRQENQQEKDYFDEAIDEDYAPSVGNPPAWETPVE